MNFKINEVALQEISDNILEPVRRISFKTIFLVGLVSLIVMVGIIALFQKSWDTTAYYDDMVGSSNWFLNSDGTSKVFKSPDFSTGGTTNNYFTSGVHPTHGVSFITDEHGVVPFDTLVDWFYDFEDDAFVYKFYTDAFSVMTYLSYKVNEDGLEVVNLLSFQDDGQFEGTFEEAVSHTVDNLKTAEKRGVGAPWSIFEMYTL